MRLGFALAIGFGVAASASAQIRPILQQDSFAIGEPGGVLCQVQDKSTTNPARKTMFDRHWQVVCRDSARAVANIYAFREPESDPASLIAPYRAEDIDCSGGALAASASGKRQCLVAGTKLGWSIFTRDEGKSHYVAEGYSAYDDAIALALDSILANRVVDGTIDVASTSVADPVAFARVQAETLAPEQALGEGYRRNLGGDYAEAAAYFQTLQTRLEGKDDADINPGEFLINRALQKSNLRQFAEADRLFIEAESLTRGDPVAERLQRNFETIHLINQGYIADALERVNQPLSAKLASADEAADGLRISRPLAARLNADRDTARLLGFVDELSLTATERAEIIDAQALQLRGTSLRLLGRRDAARQALLDGYNRAIAVRDGRVVTIVRLRAQILGELSALAEAGGDIAGAQNYLQSAVALIASRYPERRVLDGAKARLAAFFLRHDQAPQSLALYSEVIDSSLGKRDAASGFANQLAPYFRYLAPRAESDPKAAADFFKALQVLVRPGVAETQSVLARRLSASSAAASRLFRQSTNLSREIEQVRIASQALDRAEQSAANSARLKALGKRLETLETEQLRTQAALSAYPQYRVIAPKARSLDELQAVLGERELYVRFALIGGSGYVFATGKNGASKAFRINQPISEIEYLVDMLRSSISVSEGGRNVTYPYDVETAYALYSALFAPLAGQLAGADHVIFEPDGPLLRLPVDVLVADKRSVDLYLARQQAKTADPFDFTGVNWFARSHKLSVAVSVAGFIDARGAPRSKARLEYIGLGSNVPVGDGKGIRALAIAGSEQCGWKATEWDRPISDKELRAAASVIGADESRLVTGAKFTDTALEKNHDLANFRIMHFATHGLVTPPRPSCPARPALLTSFGGKGSDGLLSFDEIFDLDLDADLVILSACDTAGGASIEATRAAGVPDGGGTALDGLVRSFVAAGARSVLASHWPAPDEFNATQRLMSEMFRAGGGHSLGQALRTSQQLLMDDPATSHPYYWGGFSIIGDAARPLIEADSSQIAARAGDASGANP